MGILKTLLSVLTGRSVAREKYDHFNKVGKPALTRQLVYMRMVREALPPFDSEAFVLEESAKVAQTILAQIQMTVDEQSDTQLLGTPEATMVIILQQYWRMKLQTNESDFEVFKKTEKLRYSFETPKNFASPDIDLATFITHIIRHENPECSPENISDETIRALVELASAEVKELYEVLLLKPR